jgi:acyl carrier protein
MVKDDFIKVLKEDVFSECTEIINFDTDFKALDCWDSITSLTLIAIFDGEFNVSLSGDDIRSATTIDDLYQRILNK